MPRCSISCSVSADQEDPKKRISDLEERVLLYEIEARRTVGDLFRLREAFERSQTLERDVELLDEMEAALAGIQGSRFWRLRKLYIAAKIRAGRAPKDTALEFSFAERTARLRQQLTDRYVTWMNQNTPRQRDLARMRELVPLLPYRPLVSVLVPAYETPETYLRLMIDSVIAQTYPHWELCIVDDASPSPIVADVVAEYAQRDARIKFQRRSENGHISRSSNDALALATGDFVALLDHDDLLAPEALFSVVTLLNREHDADFVYSDEDKVDEAGIRSNPFFKPDWSPDSFLTRMYTAHLAVFRRSLLEAIGGFRAGFEGSQDYDLVLRVTEQTTKIFHIPEILYHWRVHSGSVTSGAEAKPYAYEAAIKALSEAMERRNEGGRIEHLGEDRGNYVVRYAMRRPRKVSVIIPTRDLAEDVRRCVESIFARTTYPDFEVVLLDNGSVKPETARLIERFERTEPERFRVVRHDVPFNYSEINNFAAKQARGDYFLFLNNDTEVLVDEWMTLMVEQAQRDSIGAVGAKLLYGDGSVQHAGVIIGIGGIAGHAFRHFNAEADGYYNFLRTANNYSAVTAACLMTRRSVFEEVGGFDEELAIAYNDVDLCLRIGQAGYRIIYLPYVELRHYESKSRGYDITEEQEGRDHRERLIMQRKWNVTRFVDPYYNPNLTLEREDFSIAP
jgi:GT2 family glycosyltransferase